MLLDYQSVNHKKEKGAMPLSIHHFFPAANALPLRDVSWTWQKRP
jgi:hypothetical protein